MFTVNSNLPSISNIAYLIQIFKSYLEAHLNVKLQGIKPKSLRTISLWMWNFNSIGREASTYKPHCYVLLFIQERLQSNFMSHSQFPILPQSLFSFFISYPICPIAVFSLILSVCCLLWFVFLFNFVFLFCFRL